VRVLGRSDVPFKCIGLAIDTLQRAGHPKVGFTTEPPSERR
jgi:hypothetical protein